MHQTARLLALAQNGINPTKRSISYRTTISTGPVSTWGGEIYLHQTPKVEREVKPGTSLSEAQVILVQPCHTLRDRLLMLGPIPRLPILRVP
jgi:hypothetical protein